MNGWVDLGNIALLPSEYSVDLARST